MFSTFTKLDDRALIIRAIDVRRFEDTVNGTLLVFEECGGAQEVLIQGTAQENMDRLKAEETELLIASEKLRQRQQNGYPPIPVTRGRIRG
jgi:hypothetical protein